MKNKLSLLFFLFLLILLLTSPVNAQDSQEYPIYVIQPGDSVGGIANLFGVSVTELLQINNITNPDLISPGQELMIPGFSGISGTITPVVINLGETAKGIIAQHHCDVNEIVRLNKISSFSEIFAGSTLLIPIDKELSQLISIGSLDQNITLLEKSVIFDQNQSVLLLENNVSSGNFVFSGDVLYKTPKLNEKPVNQISASIEELSVSPLPLMQGRTITIHVNTIEPLSLSGLINGHELFFYTIDNVNHFALQGINAMEPSGLTDFSLTGSNGVETVLSYEQNILLVPGSFETDSNLIVDPDLIDPSVTLPELEKITELTSFFTPEKFWDGPFISPDSDYGTIIPDYYRDITSYFGNRRTYNDDPKVTFHTGIDFGGGIGLPIVAPADGKVVFADFLTVRGNATYIDHGLGVYSGFFHQSRINVHVGDIVTKGQKIGEVGNTGRVDGANEFQGAGAHLHWELWVAGEQVNPFDWVNNDYP